MKNNEVKQATSKLKDLKILYTNADQLTPSKKDELERIVDREKPHLIALCEVKPKHGELRRPQEYNIPEYKLSNHTNIDKDEGRGVVILSHDSISHLVNEIECTVTFEEACLVEVRLSNNDILIFACLYRSPTVSESSIENNRSLNSLLRTIALNKKYTHKCLVGDFNLPSINWENWTTPHNEESKEERFLDALRDSSSGSKRTNKMSRE